ncbi:MAG: hypothetical protein IJ329_04585 [Clostridia bacterium]|nr:hypothetical protein [Clostridia bacterium]
MKRLISFLISLTVSACLLVGVTACGGVSASDNNSDGLNVEKPDDMTGGDDTTNNEDSTGGDDTTNNDENTGGDETPTLTVLPKPTLTMAPGLASWEQVDGAVKYVYKFGVDGQEMETTETSVAVTEYCLFCVKAIGDGETYESSIWASYDYKKPTVLEVTGVHLNSSTGVVTWEKNQYAQKYVYRIDDGEIVDGGVSGSVTITETQTIYFKAIGDGLKYADSDWWALSGGNSSIGGYV